MNTHASSTRPKPALLITALLVGTWLFAPSAQAATFTYDFEGLSLGNLNGQDNWAPEIGGAPFVVTNGVGTDTSQVVGTTGSGTSNFFGRENDGSFSFGSLAGVSSLTLGFDTRYVDGGNGGVNNQALFNLSYDPGLPSQSQSPAFGLNGNALIIAGAGGAALPIGLGFGDWISLRLAMDLTANSGNGSGSLSYKNLTDGDVGFTPVVGLQNVSLDLLANDPTLWNLMLLRTGFYAGNKIDNLYVAVPEPPTILLLLAAGFGGLLLRRQPR